MGIFQDLFQDFRESRVLSSELRTTGALMVPRWEFFDQQVSTILDHIATMNGGLKSKIGAVLDVGYGTGRLPETLITRRNALADDGLYIGVDCNPKSMEFMRKERNHLLDDKERVHLIEDYAQNIGDKLKKILDGRKLQATVVSLPHSWTSEEDLHAIWEMITEYSADNAMAIVYNVSSTRERVAKYWQQVDTHTERHAHMLWIPPWFEVNVAKLPIRVTETATVETAQHVNDARTDTPELAIGQRSV